MMRQSQTPDNEIRSNERGNVLWFILIAVVLLSSLTFMLSRSGGSVNQSGDVEQLRIKATQLMRYASSIEHAIDRLKTVHDCSENEISFENSTVASYTNAKSPSDNSCHIFAKEGAGLKWRTFGDDDLNNGGSNMAFMNGFRIEDIGEHTATSGSELLLAARTSRTLCQRINTELGLSNTVANITVTTADWDNFYVGTFADNFQIEAAGDAPDLSGAQAGCMIDANGHYVFYHAVLVR